MLPVGIICVAYVKIYKKIKDHNRSVLRNTQHVALRVEEEVRGRASDVDQGQSQMVMSMERKIAKTGFIMAIGFCSAWMPYAVVSMIAVRSPSSVSPLAATVPAIIAKSSTSYFPIIYGLTHSAFKRELIRMVRRKPERN